MFAGSKIRHLDREQVEEEVDGHISHTQRLWGYEFAAHSRCHIITII